MKPFIPHTTATFLVLLMSFCLATPAHAASLPDPVLDTPLSGPQSVVFAGGCFWGVQEVFKHVKGVISATSGYSGGSAETADYDKVSSGGTGHAEAVQVVFDPAEVNFGQLLRVFFSVAHDPTQRGGQGPDTGTQYRSALFYANPEQKQIAEAYVAQLEAAKIFSGPIVTQIVALETFYPAEAYHQNYAELHPTQPYIVIHDAPKVANLKKEFPGLYKEAR